ncbi:hypothetical protein LCL89_04595 [Halobacillus yeomjeoni]|uniref:MotE family protein n=1 Tax=Halobacillus yeomjeoni TaxID=311194 RepID=UPI001CD62879|nr:hypothetical protein [Halobacillus yeomjeoni]MCA0983327.1 hypothetical protein [Halobacillus yeomjeoni]
MAKKDRADQDNGSKLQWFFFVVIIPIVFAITLALIVFTLMGVNVFEQAEKYANKVPGLSQVVNTEAEEEQTREKDRLQAKIANNEAQIEELEGTVASKEAKIDELKQQIVKLEADLRTATEAGEEDKEKDQRVTELAVSFEEMKPEEAATIIESMNQSLAVQVLEKVTSEERGEILGKMNPETAAGIASLILDSSSE